jgi:Flp pilus assembly protein TadG
MAAVLIVCLSGGIGIAVDVGRAYQQRQAMENMAQSGVRAGAVEAFRLSTGHSATADSRVLYSIYQAMAAAGGTVRNVTSVTSTTITYSAAPSNPCDAGYSSSDVALTAYYVDASNNLIDDPNGNPIIVGNYEINSSGNYTANPAQGGYLPTGAYGLKIQSAATCVAGLFGRVVGHKNYAVSASAQSINALAAVLGDTNAPANDSCSGDNCGTALATLTPTPTTIPTSTPTATSTPTSTGTTQPTATPSNTPDVGASYTVSEFAVYGAPASGIPSSILFAQSSPNKPGGIGDTVTLFGNGGGWANDQYANRAQGLSGIPGGVNGVVHDASFDGCIYTTVVQIAGWTNFDHGGVGHCAAAPAVGSTVTIPLVDKTTKNHDQTNCPSNGGYCAHVVGIVNVTITASSIPGLVQGTLEGVVDDPYGIVDSAPLPTVTPTSTATPTATVVGTATPTFSTPLYSIVPFAIYGTPQSSGSTQMLFTAGSADSAAGDAVTFYGLVQGSYDYWPNGQYRNRADGLSGQPIGVLSVSSLYDPSFEGCLDPAVTQVQVGTWLNYQTGTGHCAAFPAVGSTISIPVIDSTMTTGTNGITCPNGGAACVHVVAIVSVQVKAISVVGGSTLSVTGLIEGVIADPSGIVETGSVPAPQ